MLLTMTTAERIYQDLSALPEPERLRLIERAIHDLAATRGSGAHVARSPVGLWADEPDLVDEIIESIMTEREHTQLRASDSQGSNGDG